MSSFVCLNYNSEIRNCQYLNSIFRNFSIFYKSRGCFLCFMTISVRFAPRLD